MKSDKRPIGPVTSKSDRMKHLLARAAGASSVAGVVLIAIGPKLPVWMGD